LPNNYSPPGREVRRCKYGWFDQWDWLVNRAIMLAGSPKITVGPGEVAIDPHIHTLFSHCSISQPRKVLLHAASIGLGGVAIMDHNEVEGAGDVIRCADDLKARGLLPEDFLVIPATEINSNAGHVGALFIEENLPINLSPEEIVGRIHDLGGLAIAVHPYHSTGIGDAVFDAPFDAVEVECGSVFDAELVEQNRALAGEARLSGITKLGSSDAHYLAAIGSCYTVFKTEDRTLDGIRNAIAGGRSEAISSVPCKRLRGFLGKIPKLK